ncbi:MAG: chemotaxis protein CheA [Deltaproteobacteria bacterium]|nr:chemotaxis protein CheA [Deltaproteobacteria bacterium]
MELIIASPEDFLHFKQDFFLVERELPELIAQVKVEPSACRIIFLQNKIKNLVAQAALMDLQPLLPFLDAASSLVGVITHDNVSANIETLDLITELFSLLASGFNQIAPLLNQPDTRTAKKFICDLDVGLLARARAFYSDEKLDDMFAEGNSEISPAKDIIIEYVKEGLSFVSVLRQIVVNSVEQKAEVEQLRHLLVMVKGDGDVLMDSLLPGGTAAQVLHKISAIVNGLLSLAEIENHRSGPLAEEMTDLFTASLDEMENLFADLENSKIPSESSNAVISRLKAHYGSLAELSAANNFTTNDAQIPQVSLKATPSPSSSPEETFIPIKLERLEDLGDLIGELVVAKNAFRNLRVLMNQDERQVTDAFLKKTEDSFHRIISDLDGVVMKMRMQKVKTLFQRFPRLVRDLSKKLNKEIELEFAGEDTEIDNRVIGAIADPMMHLVRNALDHGVETPEQRAAGGKDKKGTIRLSAKNRDGRTIIEIYDDGKGLDPVVLRKKAVEKGVIQAHEADSLSDQEARELIFHPGFSTAEQVSEVSGRGVGMDVVLDNIRNINGIVSIDSETGKYTRLSLSLPSTISVAKGLKICFANDLYLIPMDVVIKMTCIARDKIHRIKEDAFVEINGVVYPVLGVNNLMGYRSPVESGDEFINLILVGNDKSKACLAVDLIMGIEDIVVKALPSFYAKHQEFYSGCTILAGGNIVLILNINHYLE